jgi:hypothetical protein
MCGGVGFEWNEARKKLKAHMPAIKKQKGYTDAVMSGT